MCEHMCDREHVCKHCSPAPSCVPTACPQGGEGGAVSTPAVNCPRPAPPSRAPEGLRPPSLRETPEPSVAACWPLGDGPLRRKPVSPQCCVGAPSWGRRLGRKAGVGPGCQPGSDVALACVLSCVDPSPPLSASVQHGRSGRAASDSTGTRAGEPGDAVAAQGCVRARAQLREGAAWLAAPGNPDAGTALPRPLPSTHISGCPGPSPAPTSRGAPAPPHHPHLGVPRAPPHHPHLGVPRPLSTTHVLFAQPWPVPLAPFLGTHPSWESELPDPSLSPPHRGCEQSASLGKPSDEGPGRALGGVSSCDVRATPCVPAPGSC
nr:basic proline-rich protein [Oryctolagus cuniculus]